MKIFAIGDLHLPGNAGKPMDVFGTGWERHSERIAEAWADLVGESDLMLIPGDISWAMRIDAAAEDLCLVSKLPGRKVLIRGNHDYWWNSVSKVRAALGENAYALQNDSITIGGVSIAGSRGWNLPGSNGFNNEDEKIYKRELLRLNLSLSSMDKGNVRIAMTHFPPMGDNLKNTGFTDLLKEHHVQYAVYGHLHGRACRNAFEGEMDGIRYFLCSADHLGFTPRLIAEV